jgi:2-dehydro-3-deoxyglucarate aldolase/4-hydroxy-2-oxoheptanedioate aldolase
VRCRDAGYRYVMVSADTTLFANAARDLIDETRSALR